MCENQMNNFTFLDSSMCVSMVTPFHKPTASSVSITGIFHGSLPISPPGATGRGLEERSAERESTSVINSINPVAQHRCPEATFVFFFVCLCSSSFVCFLLCLSSSLFVCAYLCFFVCLGSLFMFLFICLFVFFFIYFFSSQCSSFVCLCLPLILFLLLFSISAKY